MQNRFRLTQRASAFPFQRNNRNKDGAWDAPLADRNNILGTSVDPYEPVWPRWKQKPPPRHEGDFVSDEPFYDIDEISGKVELYPPGRPLRDGNVDGNPARRQRVDDLPAGNSWRRRLLVGNGEEVSISTPNVIAAAERPALPPRPGTPFNPFTEAPVTVCLPEHQELGVKMPESCFTYGEWKFSEPFVYVDPRTGKRTYFNPGARNYRGEDKNRNKIPDELEGPDGPYLVRPGPTN